jgi:hypothetical protein
MPSLSEIFNPTLIVFLGILLLVVALLVFYFESKTREQNHKISSMLSLVSTMAEEINGMNMRLNTQMIIPNMIPQNMMPQNMGGGEIMSGNKNTNNLITVSDDSESDSGDDSDEIDDESNTNNSDSDCDSDSNEETDNESTREIEISDDNIETIEIGNFHNDVKILRLNALSDNKENDLDIDIEDLDESDDDNDDINDDLSSKSSESSNNDINDINEINNEEEHTTNDFIKTLNLKSINIDPLEEHKENIDTSMDYKKMAIGKLRSIISEKGLHEDPSKLKKQELLKLLGVE